MKIFISPLRLVVLQAALFLLCVNVFAQVYPLSKFRAIPLVPKAVAPNYLNGSDFEIHVERRNDSILLTQYVYSITTTFQLPNGKLVGLNRGEWGGEISYVPTDTSQKKVLIKSGNVKYIFEFKGQILFIEGLAHMSYSGGSLNRLDTSAGNYTWTELVAFSDAPEAYCVLGDSILIAAYETFFIVHDFKAEILLQNCYWSSLYPNSIAAFDKRRLFIGMRGGYLSLDLTTRKQTFYEYIE